MGDDDFTGSQFSLWVPLSRTLELVAEKTGNAAAQEIVLRLSKGLLEARAQSGFWEAGRTQKQLPDLCKISLNIWKEVLDFEWLASQSMWSTNTVIVEVGRSPTTTFQFFGIRIGPDGLESVGIVTPRVALSMAAARREPTPAQPQPQEQSVEPEQRGPPVSKSALQAWFAAYQAAFKGTEDTEARALESARGCFPGKSVSRDAVRALRGAQKRGPKSDTAK